MAISVVQTKTNTGAGVTTLAVTLTATVAQNTLIVCVGNNSTNVPPTGVATSGGQNLTLATQALDGNNANATIWYLDNVPGGQTSVTVTWPAGPSHSGVVAYEVSGVYAAGGSFDQTAVAFLASASPTAWTSGASPTLSQSAEIAIGCSAQIGISLVITGPASPWTNTSAVSSGGVIAGQKIVAATTAVTYNGSTTHSGTEQTATVVATFKAGTPPPLSSTSPFTPPTSATGTPSARPGTSASSPGAAYVAFPSAFRLPTSPARGRPAAVRGSARSSPGAAYVAFVSPFHPPAAPATGTPSARPGASASSPGAPLAGPAPFTPPRRPARGQPSATKGTTRQATGTKFIHVVPPGPAPFTPPTGAARGKPSAVRGSGRGLPGAPRVGPAPFTAPSKPATGRRSAVPGTSASSPGAPYFHISVFTPPTGPATGTPSARRGTSASSPGARWVSITTPSPFALPHKPARGRAAAVPGSAASSPGARFVLVRTSPFSLPTRPAKGRPNLRRGRSGGTFARFAGSPQVPRALIISIAAADGVDDYGNPFFEGVGTYQDGQASLLNQASLYIGSAAQLFGTGVPGNIQGNPGLMAMNSGEDSLSDTASGVVTESQTLSGVTGGRIILSAGQITGALNIPQPTPVATLSAVIAALQAAGIFD